jgi:hypothetical protein
MFQPTMKLLNIEKKITNFLFKLKLKIIEEFGHIPIILKSS